MTQRQVAEATGGKISQQMVGLYLKGAVPGLDLLPALAEALDVPSTTITYLFDPRVTLSEEETRNLRRLTELVEEAEKRKRRRRREA